MSPDNRLGRDGIVRTPEQQAVVDRLIERLDKLPKIPFDVEGLDRYFQQYVVPAIKADDEWRRRSFEELKNVVIGGNCHHTDRGRERISHPTRVR